MTIGEILYPEMCARSACRLSHALPYLGLMLLRHGRGQYLLEPGKGSTGAEVNQLHVHGGSALMEVRIAVTHPSPTSWLYFRRSFDLFEIPVALRAFPNVMLDHVP